MMFTGLINEIGKITAVSRVSGSSGGGAGGGAGSRAGALVYSIECPKTAQDLAVGASVAVNGVCQTVTRLAASGFEATAVSSTLQKTSFSRMTAGSPVNLEPALKAGDPLDGHILQGHVQSTGRLLSVKKDGAAHILTVRAATGGAAGIIAEGSVGVDGVSLTVSSCRDGEFSVHIIPKTWDSTVLSLRRPGEFLNIEGDILLRGHAERRRHTGRAASENQLREWGY